MPPFVMQNRLQTLLPPSHPAAKITQLDKERGVCVCAGVRVCACAEAGRDFAIIGQDRLGLSLHTMSANCLCAPSGSHLIFPPLIVFSSSPA